MPSPDATELTVGQVAARSGVAVTTLHFYENKGLIRSRRTTGNQRRYPRDTLRRVSFIRVAQRVGIPLRLIADALSGLPDERTPTREDWTRLSASWRAELDQRITQLQRLRDNLSDCIGCGCLSIDRCVLRNPDDELGNAGPGPRRLLDQAAYPTRESRRPILEWARSLLLDGEPADVTERVEGYGKQLATSDITPKLLLTFDSSPTLLIGKEMADWCTANISALETQHCGAAGHHAPEDQPEAIARAITAWARRHNLIDHRQSPNVPRA